MSRRPSSELFTGQRYSVIVEANQKVDNYCQLARFMKFQEEENLHFRTGIRAMPDLNDPSFTDGKNSAILRYAGAHNVDPTTTQSPSVLPLVETNLHVSPLTINNRKTTLSHYLQARENPQAVRSIPTA